LVFLFFLGFFIDVPFDLILFGFFIGVIVVISLTLTLFFWPIEAKRPIGPGRIDSTIQLISSVDTSTMGVH